MSYVKTFEFPYLSIPHNSNASFSCVGFIFNMAILSSLGIFVAFFVLLLFFFSLSSSFPIASALISFSIAALFSASLRRRGEEEETREREARCVACLIQ